jgi:hypothetical protein
VLDFEGVLGGKGDVLVGVALRVDNDGRACLFVSKQVRGMRQARQVKLFEDQFRSPFCAVFYFG